VATAPIPTSFRRTVGAGRALRWGEVAARGLGQEIVFQDNSNRGGQSCPHYLRRPPVATYLPRQQLRAPLACFPQIWLQRPQRATRRPASRRTKEIRRWI
jgi:hypothetical protein